MISKFEIAATTNYSESIETGNRFKNSTSLKENTVNLLKKYWNQLSSKLYVTFVEPMLYV